MGKIAAQTSSKHFETIGYVDSGSLRGVSEPTQANPVADGYAADTHSHYMCTHHRSREITPGRMSAKVFSHLPGIL